MAADYRIVKPSLRRNGSPKRWLDGLSDAVSTRINEAMRLERERHLAAAAYERGGRRLAPSHLTGELKFQVQNEG